MLLKKTVQTRNIYGSQIEVTTAYENEVVNADFIIVENSDAYSGLLVRDNKGADVLQYPSATGERVYYENGEEKSRESAGSTHYDTPVEGSDVYFSNYFSNYINNFYEPGTADGLLSAIRQSLNLHRYTLASVVSGNQYSGTVTYSGTTYDALVETSVRYRYILDNPSAVCVPNISLEWSLWQFAYWYEGGDKVAMPYALALGLLNVNQDIDEGLIDVPPEIKQILDDTLPKRGISSRYRVNWKVNVDGKKNPIITLVWDGVDESLTSYASVTTTVGQARVTYTNRNAYNDKPITKTFEQYYGKVSTNVNKDIIDGILDKVIEGINSIVGGKVSIRLIFQCTYTILNANTGDKAEQKTSKCYVDISSDGTVGSYGIMAGEKQDGSTVTVSFNNTDDFIEDFPDDDTDVPDDPLDPGEGQPVKAVSGLSLMTKTYVIEPAQMRKLGAFLWSPSFTDAILNLNQSPIENILSCKVLPVAVPHDSTQKYIKLGNVVTDAQAYPVAQNTNIAIDIKPGGFLIAEKYHNFLDYTATKITVFLPFCGFYELDTNAIMGKYIDFKYYVDIITGVCKVTLFIKNIAGAWVPIQEFNGQIGFDIPLTAQNRASQELAQVTSLASGVMGIARGDIMGTVSGLAGGVIRPKDNIQSKGSASPVCNMMTSHDVYLTIERPKVQYPSNYGRVYGYPCFLTLTLQKCKGFTQCYNVDVDNVSATDTEKDLIKQALESGVYIR